MNSKESRQHFVQEKQPKPYSVMEEYVTQDDPVIRATIDKFNCEIAAEEIDK